MSILIKNATIVNEGEVFVSDLLIEDKFIKSIERNIEEKANNVIDAKGLHLFPGVIDDQVHFREPGLTHKGDLFTESRAAVAGGVTSFMEMPNTVPSAVTVNLLENKYSRAAEVSLANYSFFMGTTNNNLKEIHKVDYKRVCGLKIFLGSSTGDMLVDNQDNLNAIFKEVKTIIAVHAEHDPTVKKNLEKIKEFYGEEDVPAYFHAIIRNDEVCYKSSSKAVDMASKYGTRLHILHISTAKELSLFTNKIPLREKKITSEACIHHLWFYDEDYSKKGNLIKWNPAVKTLHDREKIWEAVLDGRIDVIATDHAPHTLEEKSQSYYKAPSGGPLIQHSLNAMLDFHKQGRISLEQIALKMSHNVADLFQIDKRGYIREGYFADLVLVDLNKPYTVKKENLLYKCGWSPFEDHEFSNSISHALINGRIAFESGQIVEGENGMRLTFNR
ncbi:MAG: dihydroorotase [Bacteroidota bacterium]|jgi:dihydroorotase